MLVSPVVTGCRNLNIPGPTSSVTSTPQGGTSAGSSHVLCVIWSTREGMSPADVESSPSHERRIGHQTASTASTIQSAPNHIAAPCMQHHGHFYLEAGGKGGKSRKIYHGTCG